MPGDALTAARALLAATVEPVNPATPAADLLRYLTDYRACLAALVGASTGDNWHAPAMRW